MILQGMDANRSVQIHLLPKDHSYYLALYHILEKKKRDVSVLLAAATLHFSSLQSTTYNGVVSPGSSNGAW